MANFPGTTGDDVYGGTSENDLIFDGGGGNDSLAGGSGDDIVTVTGGFDTVDGGVGSNDQLVVDYTALTGDFQTTGSQIFRVSGGHSVTYTGVERLDLRMGGGNDTLAGGAGADRLHGGAGNDSISGGGAMGFSVDRLIGGLGADTLIGSAGAADYFVLETTADSPDAAPDTVRGFERDRDYIDLRPLALGSQASTIVHTTAFRSVLLIDAAGDGAFETRVVFDTAVGGSVLFNDNGNLGSRLTVIGDDTAQVLSVGGGNDVVAAGGGADRVDANDGADTLFGGDGDDTVDGGSDADVLYGGLGLDQLIGDSGADQLFGEDGNDELEGGSGTDTIFGGEGADTIDGGSDADVLVGGGGNDELDGSSGADVLVGGDGDDLIEDFSTGADQLYGGAGADTLVGSGGADTIFGGGENDRIYGDQDLTAVFAESGADVLHGEDGNDTIEGGYGADVMFGGAGADTFLYTRSLSFSVRVLESTEAAADFIGDFQPGLDVIDLSAVDADENFSGDQAFVFVATATGQDQQATLTYDPVANRTTFRGYVNDDLIADLVIVIAGNVTSDPANWIL